MEISLSRKIGGSTVVVLQVTRSLATSLLSSKTLKSLYMISSHVFFDSPYSSIVNI